MSDMTKLADWSWFEWDALMNWYKQNGRHNLPWRWHLSWSDKSVHQIAYEIWVSEVMLQQTQVSRVIDYYQRFLKRFPTIADFASVDFETFFPYYEWLGYYNRARNMLKCAQYIHSKWGTFPQSHDELIAIPGIWPYTSHAIRAFAFDQNLLAFDANLERIFSRYYEWVKRKLTKKEQTHILSDFHDSGYSGREVNSALMDFWSAFAKVYKSEDEWITYPLQNCAWGKNQGAEEWQFMKEKRKKRALLLTENTKNTLIYVFLHENHKKYFSSDTKSFHPFILAPTNENHRHHVQGYFETTYGLKVSVRPSFGQFTLTSEGKDFIGWGHSHVSAYHVQIQTGEHAFHSFQKRDKEVFMNRYFSG